MPHPLSPYILPPVHTPLPADAAGLLSLWVIYDHPSDFPDAWVARRWIVLRRGPQPTMDCLTAASLPALRALLPAGLRCLDRNPSDDPTIAEVWL